ncbi:serine/threonine-protein kinase [Pedosphaera parvula]|uniref:Serine/threonine protein kinase n=1 Tax=Pedosphaera parvula (strain Ellin514) TaxID=320771 RepID=B9XQ23_PEDPL|nr:serine/threonine-protein kinase [Pedosphaera parvula]EEF58027.1 serine/threonine protein kinase [Pedosphaera parvula Ellin514]
MDATQICPTCGKAVVPDAPQGLCPECLIKSGFETKAGNEPAGGKSAFVPPTVEQIAKLFPQFEINELLGHGGMGAVYKARQPRLDRWVALKILAPERQTDPQFAERFEREARALAWLNHPNIVTVYDFGETQGHYYLLMEFVDGLTLRQFLQARKLSPEESLIIIPQICQALQYAHEHGIIHRDIKPENILIDKDSNVKIADFGIAKLLDQEPQNISLTGAQDVMGTPHYMAPEQIEKPQTVDYRADIYSLGVVFYEMLTGELPLGNFQRPSQKAHIDVRLDEVVLHALEKDPERRYQKVSQVKTDVETIAATPDHVEPPISRTPPPIPKATPPPTGMSFGWKIAIGIAGLGAALLLIAVCVVLFFAGTKPKQSQTLAAGDLVSSNAFWNLLNADQRLVVQYTDYKFHKYFDARTFEGWSNEERTNLERRLIDTIKGPHSEEYYLAINSLASLHSTNAVPLLLEMALDHRASIVRLETSNRHRWMAIRAMGIIGDRTVVPKLIHLLYHNNPHIRWWAQVSLVRLTSQNFGTDWKAWGSWWSSQNRQPPFNSEIIHWWRGQAEPNQLTKEFAEADPKFLKNLEASLYKMGFPGTLTNAAMDTGKAQAITTPTTNAQTNSMTPTLDIDPGDGTKAIQNPTEANIRKAVASLRGDAEPGFLILHKDAENMLQATCLAKDSFTIQLQEGGEQHQYQATKNLSADTTTKLLLAYRNGDPDWKMFADWKPL